MAHPGFQDQDAGPHIVPLPRQAQAIVAELRPLTGQGRFLFPGARTRGPAWKTAAPA